MEKERCNKGVATEGTKQEIHSYLKVNDNEIMEKESGGHNCCGGKNGQKPWKKTILSMGLCCGIPLVILFLIPTIGRYNPWMAGVLGLIAPFICPIFMGSMVVMMFKSAK